MSLASHRPLSHPLCQPCTALLTQAATPRNRCSRGKSSEKTIRAIGCAFLSSFLFLSLSLSFSLCSSSSISLSFEMGRKSFPTGFCNLSRDCFVPFPLVHRIRLPVCNTSRVPRLCSRGFVRVSRKRLHGYHVN